VRELGERGFKSIAYKQSRWPVAGVVKVITCLAGMSCKQEAGSSSLVPLPSYKSSRGADRRFFESGYVTGALIGAIGCITDATMIAYRHAHFPRFVMMSPQRTGRPKCMVGGRCMAIWVAPACVQVVIATLHHSSYHTSISFTLAPPSLAS
jgi:hypothetical protein